MINWRKEQGLLSSYDTQQKFLTANNINEIVSNINDNCSNITNISSNITDVSSNCNNISAKFSNLASYVQQKITVLSNNNNDVFTNISENVNTLSACIDDLNSAILQVNYAVRSDIANSASVAASASFSESANVANSLQNDYLDVLSSDILDIADAKLSQCIEQTIATTTVDIITGINHTDIARHIFLSKPDLLNGTNENISISCILSSVYSQISEKTQTASYAEEAESANFAVEAISANVSEKLYNFIHFLDINQVEQVFPDGKNLDLTEGIYYAKTASTAESATYALSAGVMSCNISFVDAQNNIINYDGSASTTISSVYIANSATIASSVSNPLYVYIAQNQPLIQYDGTSTITVSAICSSQYAGVAQYARALAPGAIAIPQLPELKYTVINSDNTKSQEIYNGLAAKNLSQICAYRANYAQQLISDISFLDKNGNTITYDAENGLHIDSIDTAKIAHMADKVAFPLNINICDENNNSVLTSYNGSNLIEINMVASSKYAVSADFAKSVTEYPPLPIIQYKNGTNNEIYEYDGSASASLLNIHAVTSDRSYVTEQLSNNVTFVVSASVPITDANGNDNGYTPSTVTFDGTSAITIDKIISAQFVDKLVNPITVVVSASVPITDATGNEVGFTPSTTIFDGSSAITIDKVISAEFVDKLVNPITFIRASKNILSDDNKTIIPSSMSFNGISALTIDHILSAQCSQHLANGITFTTNEEENGNIFFDGKTSAAIKQILSSIYSTSATYTQQLIHGITVITDENGTSNKYYGGSNDNAISKIYEAKKAEYALSAGMIDASKVEGVVKNCSEAEYALSIADANSTNKVTYEQIAQAIKDIKDLNDAITNLRIEFNGAIAELNTKISQLTNTTKGHGERITSLETGMIKATTEKY